MMILDSGYAYQIPTTTKIGEITIFFAKDEKDHRHDGITDPQIIDMMIDRYAYLTEPKPRKIIPKEQVAMLTILKELRKLV